MGLFSKLFGGKTADAPQTPAPGRRVLLVEPSITVSKVVELTLPNSTITTVTSMAAAKAAMASARPEVVIAAVVLPDGDGYELCRTMKSFHRVPVILLRGTFEPFDESKARASEADAVLSKPFVPDDLVRAIESAVRQ